MELLELISWAFDHVLVIPTTNALVLISRLSLGNYGVAIILFTLIMRAVTWPLSRQQLHAARSMQALQPRIQEIQKKHKDPKRRSEETMKLYREGGVSPLGCIWPMLVQFPIWIALYQAIRLTLGATPESLLDLSQRLYPWSYLRTAVPLENQFLWMDLGQPDPTLIMAILVGASMWVQQRMTTPSNASMDPQQASINQTTMVMMPLMFAFFTLQFPSGLALYWVATNVIGIVLQYFYMGPAQFSWRRIFTFTPAPAPAVRQAKQSPAENPNPPTEPEEPPAADEAHRRRRRRRRGRRR